MSEWSSESWRRTAAAWMDDSLAAAALHRTGPVTQPRLRPWATVLTAPTDAGPVWLKAPGAHTAFEVPLYDLLMRVCPERILRPLAVDVERGWVLLPDGGRPLGEAGDGGRLDGAALVDTLVYALPEFGRLQRSLAPHADALVGMGMVDMRPAVLPHRFDQALRVTAGYADARGDSADRDTVTRLAGLRDDVADWSVRLATAAVPASLDHNELHPWNMFRGVTGGVMFYDWGDSVVSHPFASLLMPLAFLRDMLGVSADDRVLNRPRDAYLAVFADLAAPDVLLAELELACRVGLVSRTLTWDRAVRSQGHREGGAFARQPLAMLEDLLQPSGVG